jgi:hypothetical protein
VDEQHSIGHWFRNSLIRQQQLINWLASIHVWEASVSQQYQHYYIHQDLEGLLLFRARDRQHMGRAEGTRSRQRGGSQDKSSEGGEEGEGGPP